MRHEPSFLKDILSACRKIEAIVVATSEDLFLNDEVLPAAVLHHLTVIGEAINRLSVGLRERRPEVPWRQIVAVRHRIVHAYFDLDWQILWDAATADIPELRQAGSRHPGNGVSGSRTRLKRGLKAGKIRTGKRRACQFGVKGSLLFSTASNLAPRHGFEPRSMTPPPAARTNWVSFVTVDLSLSPSAIRQRLREILPERQLEAFRAFAA